ncbi:antitoxin [Streptomyces sp. NPDC006687]|uniref:antitoxin n=1 Tax=unclassified Streptomyces TaxID=2593676 RepID=UPI0033F46006
MSIVDKLKAMLGQHPDQAKQGVERGGDMIDKRTGGKYADKVDMGQEKANEYIDRDRPPQP